jgi:hypothetical protein
MLLILGSIGLPIQMQPIFFFGINISRRVAVFPVSSEIAEIPAEKKKTLLAGNTDKNATFLTDEQRLQLYFQGI